MINTTNSKDQPAEGAIKTGIVDESRFASKATLKGESISPSAAVTNADARKRRLEAEDMALSKSPYQRKIIVLDYIRRGQLRDSSVYIMPEIIQATPHLLEAGLIDFDSNDYNEQQVIKQLIARFEEVEREVVADDSQVRGLLKAHGLEPIDSQYLDASWLKMLTNELDNYLKQLSRPIHAKNPFYGKPEEYKAEVQKKTLQGLSKSLKGDLLQFLDAYESGSQDFTINPGNRDESDPIKGFLYHRIKNGFKKYPRMDEYEGEVVRKPPSLSEQKTNPSISFISRDTLPEMEGGIILDGNFGYNEKGELIAPNDKEIIDHHDQLDTRSYDTATVMVQRKGSYKSGEPKNLMSERGRLKKFAGKDESGTTRITTMVNHLDSDSVLSLWAYRNPVKAGQYKKILNDISSCGDFLIGSGLGEFGASARDYEYIYLGYIEACQDSIKAERTKKEEESLAALENELGLLEAEQAEFQRHIDDFLRESSQAQRITAEIEAIKRQNFNDKREKGRQLGMKTGELEALVATVFSSESQRSKDLKAFIQAKKREIDALRKAIVKMQNQGLTAQENEKILAHIMSITEDIITNPFKYKEFIQDQRKKEDDTIQEYERLYREGEIEIVNDSEDNGILRISPLKAKGVPKTDSIHGQYFFFRRREDFNKKIIATTFAPGKYMVAVNTQNKKELQLYDFNRLIDVYKVKEASHIQGLIEEAQQAIEAEVDPGKKKKLEQTLQGLQESLHRNMRGQLWRNRNQMIFSMKSYMPEDEFLAILREWKHTHDSERAHQ